MKNKVYPIMQQLPVGKENAISSETLVKQLHLTSKRKLQNQIAKERNEGAIILSTTTGGYYQSSDRDEIAEFIKTLEKRARNTMKILKSAKKFLKNIEGQMSIDIEDVDV